MSLPRPERIMRQVAQKHGIDWIVIPGKSQLPRFTNARWEAAQRMRTELEMSVTEIAVWLHRDHSTVVKMLQARYPKKQPSNVPAPFPDYSGEWAI